MFKGSGPSARVALSILGVALVLVSPIVGVIPGPGGVLVFAGGLALLLRNSPGARRGFARLKRRSPLLGDLVDRAMRRASARRRRERQAAAAAN